jgi:glycosyltransferase involved in cell wall biosynthesis
MTEQAGSLLCVVNYKANTGYAWEHIERVCACVADHLALHGRATFVAYPEISAPPRPLKGSAARPIVLDATLRTRQSVRATCQIIERENVRVVYFGEGSIWRWPYLFLRAAGVRCIIVHVRTYSEVARSHWLKRAVKWGTVRIPGVGADVVVAVSHFVARRLLEVNLLPRERLHTIWNALPMPVPGGAERERVRALFDLAPERPLVVCACRASPEKGIAQLLRAFDQLVRARRAGDPDPALLYVGDGPKLAELRALRESLPSKVDIIMPGYRSDAAEIVACADVCVVPSLREAFGMAALEAMARGKAVVASRVGGLPELLEDGVHGLLVPPGDEVALAEAISSMLSDRAARVRMGEAARRRVAEHFTLDRQVGRLMKLIEGCFGAPCDRVADA